MRAASVIVVVLVMTVMVRPGHVQSPERPLPPPQTFYLAVVANLAKSDREQYRYAYRERRSEVHTNPFGRIGTGGTVTYEVIPGVQLGMYQRRLVERDGKPVAAAKPEVVDRRDQGGANPSIDD